MPQALTAPLPRSSLFGGWLQVCWASPGLTQGQSAHSTIIPSDLFSPELGDSSEVISDLWGMQVSQPGTRRVRPTSWREGGLASAPPLPWALPSVNCKPRSSPRLPALLTRPSLQVGLSVGLRRLLHGDGTKKVFYIEGACNPSWRFLCG